ncbi:MAG: hypothetical protein AB8H47_06655 [Bacteroidia bacterium]
MTQDDLDYINPYLGQVNINTEEGTFLDKGRKSLLIAQRKRRLVVAGVITILVAMLGISIWQGLEARQQKAYAVEQEKIALEKADQALLSEEKAKDESMKAKIEAQKARQAQKAANFSDSLAQTEAFKARKALRAAALSDSMARLDRDKAKNQTEVALLAKQEALKQALAAKAASLAAKARQYLAEGDATTALNLAFAAYNTFESEETTSAYKDLKIFRNKTYRQKIERTPHLVSTSSYFSNGEQLLIGGTKISRWGTGDGFLEIWDIAKEDTVRTLRGASNRNSEAIYSPNRKQILTYGFSELRLFDIEKGEIIRRFVGHQNNINAIAFSPDGKQILSGGDFGNLYLWDITAEDPIHIFEGLKWDVRSIAFSRDGKRVFAREINYNKDSKLWHFSIATGKFIETFDGNKYFNENIHLASPPPCLDKQDCLFDDQILWSSSVNNELVFWDIESGDTIRTFKGHTSKIKGLSFSPDGKQFLSWDATGGILLWDLTTNKVERTFVGHTKGVSELIFSPDGKHFLSKAEKDRIKELFLWDIHRQKFQYRFDFQRKGIYSFAFSPDSKEILTLNGYDEIMLWDINKLGQLVSKDDSKTWPEHVYKFNQAEREQYGIEVDY